MSDIDYRDLNKCHCGSDLWHCSQCVTDYCTNPNCDSYKESHSECFGYENYSDGLGGFFGPNNEHWFNCKEAC